MLIVGLLVALVAPGCRPTEPERPDYPEEMPIGMIVGLSGPHADMGQRLSVGAEVAVDQLNDWGGIRNMYSMNLTFNVADDGGSPEVAAAEAERLITEEGVIFLMGAWPTAMAVSEVAEEYEVPFICPLGLRPITQQGYEYTFRIVSGVDALASQVVDAMIDSAAETGQPAPKTCAVIYANDDQAEAAVEEFIPLAEAAGIDIVGEYGVDANATSFAVELAEIEAASPDLLFTCNYTADSVLLYQQMMDRETYFPYGVYSWGWGTESPDFYDALPEAAYAYGFVRETADPIPQVRRYYDWINDSVEPLLGAPWDDPFVTVAYNAVWVAKEGMEKMTPVKQTSMPGTGGGMEFSLDLDKFRNNLQYALATLEISRSDTSKPQLPDGSPFLPALQPLRLDRIEFDENGQNIYGGGIISQNIDGIRWPFYPDAQRETDNPDIVLPIPPWSER